MNTTQIQTVCEPADLAALLQRNLSTAQKPILLDIRPESACRMGHLKDAVWLNLADWVAAASSKDSGLNQESAWFRRIGELGIHPTDAVVVYDDGTMVEAARVWFILQHFGVTRAAVLDGGYPAIEPLVPRSLIETGGAGRAMTPVAFHPAPGTKKVVALAGKSSVLWSVETHHGQILDARTPAEYAGTERMKNPGVGHLPGAVNLSHEQLLDADGKLKSPEQRRQLLATPGLKPGEPIVTHCQGGGRAAVAALAAVGAGYGPVAVYYMSFGEWAADDRCPLETPASQPAR